MVGGGGGNAFSEFESAGKSVRRVGEGADDLAVGRGAGRYVEVVAENPNLAVEFAGGWRRLRSRSRRRRFLAQGVAAAQLARTPAKGVNTSAAGAA